MDRRLKIDAGIPGSSSRVIESSAMRSRMREGSVHDMCLGDAVEQFAGLIAAFPPRSAILRSLVAASSSVRSLMTFAGRDKDSRTLSVA